MVITTVLAIRTAFQPESLDFTAFAGLVLHSKACRVSLEGTWWTTGPAQGRERTAPERHWSAKVVPKMPD